MGRKKVPGLQKRRGVWQIDKVVCGQRICESTETSNLEEAERYLVHRVEQIRNAHIYGVRPHRTFSEAAEKYLFEKRHKASVENEIVYLEQLKPYIGKLALEQVHIGTLQPFIEARQKAGIKTKTINLALATVRHLLNLAASEWLDENGLTWLQSAPKIKLLPVLDARKPYQLTWEKQEVFFKRLPEHLREMALFKVNTGCREQEVCGLRWKWEIEIPDLKTSIFLIPAEYVKNREDRLVVLNDIAKSVIDRMRGKHPEYVFTFRGRRLQRMNETAWRSARSDKKINLTQLRVHDLKHTYGMRLRAAGVSFEDRQDLLGHQSGRITTHYSASQIESLIAASNKVCQRNDGITLSLLKRQQEEKRIRLQEGHADITRDSLSTGSALSANSLTY